MQTSKHNEASTITASYDRMKKCSNRQQKAVSVKTILIGMSSLSEIIDKKISATG